MLTHGGENSFGERNSYGGPQAWANSSDRNKAMSKTETAAFNADVLRIDFLKGEFDRKKILIMTPRLS